MSFAVKKAVALNQTRRNNSNQHAKKKSKCVKHD